jgi:hypothetical protein
MALDASQVAIDRIRSGAEQTSLSNRVTASRFDFEAHSLKDIQGVNANQSLEYVTVVIYARFLLHALTEAGEDGLWALVEDVIANSPGSLYLAMEYRTPQDADLPKQTPTHFRRYIEPSRIKGRAEELGFTVLMNEQGSGFSVFGADDAHLARQIFRCFKL